MMDKMVRLPYLWAATAWLIETIRDQANLIADLTTRVSVLENAA